MDKILSVTHLSVMIRNKERIAYPVQDMSFYATKGETIALVGESGCGKTTTANAIVGIWTERDKYKIRGDILFDGKPMPPYGTKEHREIMGPGIFMIPQNAMNALNPTMKAGYQVSDIMRKCVHLSKAEARLRTIELFEKVHIDHAKEVYSMYPYQLSGGMCQRVMISMALAFQSRLLIADEPTTALDQITSAQTMECLKRLQKDCGSTLIIISHDLEFVAKYSDTVAVIYAGKNVETGSRDVIMQHPMHPYTKCILLAGEYPKSKSEALYSIEGCAPSVFEKTEGCAFAGRCPKTMNICLAVTPPLVKQSDSHCVQCHLSGIKKQ